MTRKPDAVVPILPVVKNEPPDEVAPEVLAKAIVEVADAAKKLLGSRLTKRAIVVLLADMLRARSIGMNAIEEVLDAAASLKARYIRPEPK